MLALVIARRHNTSLERSNSSAPPEVTLQLHPVTPRPFVESKESTPKPPKKTLLESNEDTRAASERLPDGTLPLPSQQGVTQTTLELQNQRYTPGETPAAAAPGSPSSPSPPPPLPPTPDQDQQKKTSPQPSVTPEPLEKPSKTFSEKVADSTPPPRNNIQLLQPPPPVRTSTDVNQAKNLATHSQQSMISAVSNPGAAGARKGYQPETRQTVIQGNISNRGKSSFEAEATPIGRYKKALADAIGSRWYYYVNERMGLLSIGSVSITFKVNARGKVTNLHVVSSNSNESLTDCSIRSIMDAKFPPIPPEVAPTLQNGSLDIDFSFTIY